MKFNKIFVAAAVSVVAAGCVKEQVGDVDLPVVEDVVVVADAPKLIAELDEPETRTCIDADANATGKLSMLWTPSDEVGVFTSGGDKNVRYVNDEQSVNVPNASFSATASVKGDIQYVYYPYSSANNGKEATDLSGTVPAEQVMGQSIAGDYKYGTLKSVTEDGGYKFKFNNMFSLVRFDIDATGTALADATLETVTLTVTRDGAAVPVAGDFTFRALDGAYTLKETSDVLTTTWNQELNGTLSSFASVFPQVRIGDKLNFEIKAGDYVATLTVTSKANFAPGVYYTFPLTLSKFSAAALKIKKVVRGNFTAATMNVDGLPQKVLGFIPINPEGPGSSGTKSISSLIASCDWDFVGFSEDFQYHSELQSALSSYKWGTYAGNYSNSSTDGLEFAVHPDVSFANETRIAFTSAYGGLTDGANTSITKGIRYYLVTLNGGVQVDVIITHMNTWDSERHEAAQYAQLQQIANYINEISAVNKRPIIFMGDTNCRYTRHDFRTNFWDVLNDNVEVHDAWVEHHRGGQYPECNTRSLMIRANFKGDKENDIVCSDDQRGEVVDKIIYFNVDGAATRISAIECYNDVAHFTKSTTDVEYPDVMAEDADGNISSNQTVAYTKNVGYADHFPVVAKFEYESLVDIK